MDAGILIDIVVFLIVFGVNFIGVISGGGALIIRPLLILLGVPPQMAIGSTRTANVGTRLIGLTQFHKYGKIDWKLALLLLVPATIGSFVGVQIVVNLDPVTLTKVMGYAILLSGVLLLFKKKIGTVVNEESGPSLGMRLFGAILYGVTTIIATLTGGGGVINNYILIFIYKKSYITSAAVRSVAGFGGAVIGAVLFIYYDLINWHYVILIFLSGGLGSYFGVHYGIHRGEDWVRWIVLIVVFIFGLKMIF
jgi:uncharacterized protein